MNRETWLEHLAARLAPEFERLGFPLPSFRVAIGFPSTGARGRRVAECWDKRASTDGHFEILIRPDEDDAMEVANSLVHELAHAAAGLIHGHKGDFEKICLAMGMLRPMTATPSGPKFREMLAPHLAVLGPLPHAALNFQQRLQRVNLGPTSPGMPAGEQSIVWSSAPPKQGTRLRKATCEACGYTARVAQKWLAEVGAPHCPKHGAMSLPGSRQ